MVPRLWAIPQIKWFIEQGYDRLWNADESGFPLQHRSGTLRFKDRIINYLIQQAALACINAAGSAIPPMPGKRFRSNPLEGAVHGTYVSSSGLNHFTKSIRPVVLLLDGHSSHKPTNCQIGKERRHSIVLLAYTYHTRMWCRLLQAHEGKLDDVCEQLCVKTQENPLPNKHLPEFLVKCGLKLNLINSFKGSGICPLPSVQRRSYLVLPLASRMSR